MRMLTNERQVMRCPICLALDADVKDSRPRDDVRIIFRKRQCRQCAHRFNTYERTEYAIKEERAKLIHQIKAMLDAL